jgi:hypothetical protein
VILESPNSIDLVIVMGWNRCKHCALSISKAKAGGCAVVVSLDVSHGAAPGELKALSNPQRLGIPHANCLLVVAEIDSRRRLLSRVGWGSEHGGSRK